MRDVEQKLVPHTTREQKGVHRFVGGQPTSFWLNCVETTSEENDDGEMEIVSTENKWSYHAILENPVDGDEWVIEREGLSFTVRLEEISPDWIAREKEILSRGKPAGA